MNCDQVLEWISAALDGELDGAEQAELNAHLDSCPDCCALYEDWMAMQTALLDGMEEPPDGFYARVMEAVAAEPLPEERTKPRTRRKWAAIVAAAAVAALAILPQTNFGRMGINGGASGGNGVAPMIAAAPAGGAEAYSAEDGTAMADNEPMIEARSNMNDLDAPAADEVLENAQSDILPTFTTEAASNPIPAAVPAAPAHGDNGGVLTTSGSPEEAAQQSKIILTVDGELPEGYAWNEDGTLELPVEELPQLEAALTEAGIPYDIEAGTDAESVLVVRLD